MVDVLIVDDDFMVAEIHRRFVDRTDGFTAVGVARNGAEALDAVAALHPDLVLLDVHLPDMSGLAVLRKLRADGNPVGVIMITAARELDTVSGALHGGAADYLIKPFEYPQLQEKLDGFRARAATLRAGSGADQSLIDSLFGGSSTDTRKDELPKGLSAETGALVLDAVRTDGELSSSECADRVGLSRVSARRYLEHYLAKGALEIRLQYGKAGRPERRYRLAHPG
ncbi:response regulator [Antrihabitans cavernicola]|uniref:Transcriptional regulatory protein n=1 Tax=Antrihabitans cavernicola TaxID=2495913 RepID=A0A5A7SFD8_9NOCA|nr:response regulator [Spelaeibacter cavernicola]KAA0024294.1 response regulator [Spelaeibacter cavernicola]